MLCNKVIQKKVDIALCFISMVITVYHCKLDYEGGKRKIYIYIKFEYLKNMVIAVEEINWSNSFTPQLSWNTTNVDVKYQSANQSKLVEYIIFIADIDCSYWENLIWNE